MKQFNIENPMKTLQSLVRDKQHTINTQDLQKEPNETAM